ncbi:hypothetical protein GQ85_38940 [Rhodococcus rhodochrous]|nr:hypothetical protein GQ85_38940 [Rhodococcus rhodochrous]
MIVTHIAPSPAYRATTCSALASHAPTVAGSRQPPRSAIHPGYTQWSRVIIGIMPCPRTVATTSS